MISYLIKLIIIYIYIQNKINKNIDFMKYQNYEKF